MKKKVLVVFLAISLMLSVLPGLGVFADDNVKVVLNGRALEFDVPPQLINGRTMVPLRVIFESLDATVDWNDVTQTVTSTRGATTVSLTIGMPSISINGYAVALDSPPCVINGRTLVPVRAISEAFGVGVAWDGATSTVFLTGAPANSVAACPVCGSVDHTVHPACAYCGSTAHATQQHPLCPTCGSADHTVHPACAYCGSTAHATQQHPTCPTCGSADHVVHPQVTTTAFAKLKDYLVNHGTYNDGSYSVIYEPNLDSSSNVTFFVSYDIADNDIGCLTNVVTYTSSGRTESTTFLFFYENDVPGLAFSVELAGTEFEILGSYYTLNAPYTEFKNTFPTASLQASGRKLLNTSLETTDLLLQIVTGQSVSEFGVYYSKY